jgi:hypothetical protein
VYGYVFYSVGCGERGGKEVIGAFAHTLVALKYINSTPPKGYEIDHIDGDKANNHYGNLRWVTRSENIMNSFRQGRRGYWAGKKKPPHSVATKMLMANAKKKRVIFSRGGDIRMFESIDEAARVLGTYRKRVYLCVKESKPFNGGVLRYDDDVM